MSFRWMAAALAIAVAFPHAVSAQSAESGGWHVMQDAVVYGLFNHQGGPRGGDELRVPNWWMGMFEPESGIVEPHDQHDAQPRSGDRRQEGISRAVSGRRSVRGKAAHRLSASARSVHAARGRLADPDRRTDRVSRWLEVPSAEPALGPVAFMHRASAMENPMSPLVAPHVRFDAHRVRGGDGGGRPRAMDDRSARSSTAASPTKIDGTSTSARSTRSRAGCGSARATNGSSNSRPAG